MNKEPKKIQELLNLIRIAVSNEFDNKRKELKNITDKTEREEEEAVINVQEGKIMGENDYKEHIWREKLKLETKN